MRKTRMADATELSSAAFQTSVTRRAGNKKRVGIAHAYPTDWRASRLRRAVIEQAKIEEAEMEINEAALHG